MRPASAQHGHSCSSLNLAKYLGEGTSRGATEQSVAPFVFCDLAWPFMSRLLVTLAVNQPGIRSDGAANSSFLTFVTWRPSTLSRLRADFAYNFLTTQREGRFYRHDRNRYPRSRKNLQRRLLAQETEVRIKAIAPEGGRGRDFWLSRPQWSREDHHTQDAHGPGLPNRRIGANPGHGH